MSSEEDILFRNVSDLRRRLLQTERSLQSFSTPDTRSRRQEFLPTDVESTTSAEQYGTLSMDDLVSDSMSEDRMNGHSRLPRPVSTAQAYTMNRQHSFKMQPSSRASSCTSISGSDFDDGLRKKLHNLRDENAQLISQNHELMNQLESIECDLMSKDSKIKMLNMELDTYRDNEPNVEEKLVSLESEVLAHDKALRDAENRLEDSQKQLQDREKYFKKMREELKASQAEVSEEIHRRKRVEAQRDESLQSLEELNDQLAEYRTKTKEKIKKLQSNEEHLRDSLLHTDKEREELLNQAAALESELHIMQQKFKLLEDERSIDYMGRSDTDTMNIELRTQVSRQSQKITELEINLDKKTREINHLTRQLETKARDCVELQDITRRQSERLNDCQKELDTSRVEMKTLESLAQKVQDRALGASLGSDSGLSTTSTIKQNGFSPSHASSPPRSTTPQADYLNNSQSLSEDGDANLSISSTSGRAVIAELKMKLAMKDAEIQRLQRLRESTPVVESQMDGLKSELMAVVENSKMGDRKSQELEEIINRLEEERGKRASEVLELEEKLNEKELLTSSLESRVNQCNNHIADLQKEVSEKCDGMVNLEKEVRKKSSQVTELERQLNEKVSAFSLHASRLVELEDALRDRSSELGQLKGEMADKSEEFVQASSLVEKVKSLHAEHCKELEQQIEMLQLRCEEKNSQLQHMESSMASLQSELSMKSTRVEQLDKALQECRQELSCKMRDHDQAWQVLQYRASEGTTRVSQLESALVVCKEELKVYIDQLDETRERHERQLDKKNEEVRKLDKLLKQSRHDLDERENQILELQQTLHERQLMLQQSTSRIGELEDGQSQLEQQLSRLERELTQSRDASIQETENMEKKLHQACIDLEERTIQIEELTETLSQIQTDFTKTSAEVSDLNKQLHDTRRESDDKSTAIAQLDIALKDAKTQLEQRTNRVNELEQRLHHMGEELELNTKRSGQLDDELNRAGGELQQAVHQLEELQRMVQSNKKEIKRKDDKICALDMNLKEANEELMNRDRELTDLDQALKERQWELKQRAAQVAQLDMTMKEHRSELETKVVKLEEQLSKSQQNLKERSKQIADLDDQLQQQREAEKEKTLQLQQWEQTMQRQKMDLSHKMDKIEDLERKTKELSSKLNDHRKDELEQGQHLRLTREQMQRQHMDLTDTKKQLAKSQREQDRMARELEETIQVCKSKELDCSKLAEELGASRAREAAADSRCIAEIHHLRQQLELDIKQKDIEISSLQESHSTLLAAKNQQETNHRLHSQQLEERNKHITQQLQTTEDKLTSLENELRARKEVVEAANEAIVIKEAEVARLNAKISGYERATFGMRNRESSSSRHNYFPSTSGFAQSMPPLLPTLGPTLPTPQPMSFSMTSSPRTNLRRATSDYSLADHSQLNMSGVSDLRSDAGNITTRDYFKQPLPYSHMSVSHSSIGDLLASKPYTKGRVEPEPDSFQSMLQMARQEISSAPSTPSRNHFRTFSQPVEAPTSQKSLDHGYLSSGSSLHASHSMPGSPTKCMPPSVYVSPPGSMQRSPPQYGLTRSSSHPHLNIDDTKKTSPTNYNTTLSSPISPFKPSKDQVEERSPQDVMVTPFKSSSPDSTMNPEDYMLHLQERLRVNEERRRKIDEQLQSVRDIAREAQQNAPQ